MTVVRQVHRDEAALRKARMLIGGKWVESASGDVLEVEDPAHRRPVAEVPRGGAEDVARAVNAAADAFPAWSRRLQAKRHRPRVLPRRHARELHAEEECHGQSGAVRTTPDRAAVGAPVPAESGVCRTHAPVTDQQMLAASPTDGADPIGQP